VSSWPHFGEKRSSCLGCDNVPLPLKQIDRTLEARNCSLRIAGKLENLCFAHPRVGASLGIIGLLSESDRFVDGGFGLFEVTPAG
jgi:hypothetical protein